MNQRRRLPAAILQSFWSEALHELHVLAVAKATQQTQAIRNVYKTACTWLAALPFILTTQPDKIDVVLTVWMDGHGGKEGKKDGRCRGWHDQTGGGEKQRKVCKLAVDEQMESARWGFCTRCVGSVKESIMGCRLMVMVVLFASGLPCSNDNLRFSKCSSEPQRGLRNGWYLANVGLFHHKQGPGTLTLEEGNVFKTIYHPVYSGTVLETKTFICVALIAFENGADDGRGRKATCW